MSDEPSNDSPGNVSTFTKPSVTSSTRSAHPCVIWILASWLDGKKSANFSVTGSMSVLGDASESLDEPSDELSDEPPQAVNTNASTAIRIKLNKPFFLF